MVAQKAVAQMDLEEQVGLFQKGIVKITEI